MASGNTPPLSECLYHYFIRPLPGELPFHLYRLRTSSECSVSYHSVRRVGRFITLAKLIYETNLKIQHPQPFRPSSNRGLKENGQSPVYNLHSTLQNVRAPHHYQLHSRGSPPVIDYSKTKNTKITYFTG